MHTTAFTRPNTPLPLTTPKNTRILENEDDEKENQSEVIDIPRQEFEEFLHWRRQMDIARGLHEGTVHQSTDPGHVDNIPPKDLYRGISLSTLAKMTHDESIWIAAVLSQQLLRQIKTDTEGKPIDRPPPFRE